jgi:hypothetical protein
MPIAAGVTPLGVLADSMLRGSSAMQPDISSLNGTTLSRLQVSALTADRTVQLPDSG